MRKVLYLISISFYSTVVFGQASIENYKSNGNKLLAKYFSPVAAPDIKISGLCYKTNVGFDCFGGGYRIMEVTPTANTVDSLIYHIEESIYVFGGFRYSYYAEKINYKFEFIIRFDSSFTAIDDSSIITKIPACILANEKNCNLISRDSAEAITIKSLIKSPTNIYSTLILNSLDKQFYWVIYNITEQGLPDHFEEKPLRIINFKTGKVITPDLFKETR